MHKRNYLFLIVAVILLSTFGVVYATIVGPSYAGTGADDNTEGSFTWASTGNITADDGANTTVASGALTGTQHSHYIKATNFNFSIPSNATILGIAVDVKRQDGGFTQKPHDAHVYLVKAGTIQTATSDKATTTLIWPTSLTYQTYGSSTELWGNTLTPSDVNNSGFGVALNITGSNANKYGGNVDAIRMTVYYTIYGYRVMSSSNYSVQTDSLNFGGGLSSSASYSIQDTGGEIATGLSSSTNYRMSAGYQQMMQSYIAITSTGNSSLPNMGGISGGSGFSSTTWTVTTDNPAGYSLSIKASTAPAMQGQYGDNIADYVPAGSVPDYTFTILPTQSLFGYSPLGVDVVQRYLNNGSTCGVGSFSTIYNCWAGLSTSPVTISQSSSANQPSGATTTAVYEVGIGASKIQTSGSYSATITVTAVTL